MEQAGPPVILIDGGGKIVHLSAAAGRFLAFSTGWLTGDLLEIVHPALRGALCHALERANHSQRPETIPALPVCLGDGFYSASVRVSPLGETLPGHLLVTIEAHPQAVLTPKTSQDAAATSPLLPEVNQPHADLADQVAQRRAAEERHQADTEELRAMNEELRITSEELEAGKAQLQAVNDDLSVTNRALEGKVVELGRANSDLQNLMAATAIATVFLDRHGAITRYTPAATALFHLRPHDVGRPLSHFNHYLNYGALETDTAAVLTHLQPVEREVTGKGGEWFLVRLLPYRTTDDWIAGVVLTCVNITERKEAEIHRQAKEAAERINQARSEFLSRMSHELRTPLNAILGFGQILELDSRNEQDTMALGLILKAGRHLLALVDEVLDLTRAEGGELRLMLGGVELERIARECVQLTTRLSEARQITCHLDLAADPLPPLWTDEQRLRQALLNLLTNAIKYNRPGGQVTVRCRRGADAHCLISVHDTGCGIAAGDLARLFTPFERLQHQDTEIEGTGLGLAITRRLVEALGGTVGVESQPGRGSHFWIRMPWGAATAEPAGPTSVPPSAATDVAAAGNVTLLCIEDNASNLELVQMVAARYWPQWRFLAARNGDEGLEQAARHLPNLILLDLQLPDRPGDQVLAALHRNPPTARVPVVVLSADATVHSRERLLASGAAAYVTKPFQIGALVQAVNSALPFVPLPP